MSKREKINVLMVGVDSGRIGGMWSVAEMYISNTEFNNEINLKYIATSTGGSALKRFYKMIQGFLKILFYLLKNDVDIVHVHMAEKGSVFRKGFVIRLANYFGAKTIVQMHAGPIMDWYHSLSDYKKRKVKRIFNCCDKMLVLGEYWKHQLLEIVAEDKLIVLYNGTDCSNINRYNPQGRIVLFLGMITERKGAFDLINAVKIIDKRIQENIQFLLCGFDEDKKAKAYVDKLGLQNRVLFPGWVGNEEKENLFMDTRLCVLPSYFEGLSMTVIESIAHGIPIVTTNISTMSEILGDDIHLIEPGDVSDLAETIYELITNDSMRLGQSRLVYERSRLFFSIEKNIDNTIDIYKECLK